MMTFQLGTTDRHDEDLLSMLVPPHCLDVVVSRRWETPLVCFRLHCLVIWRFPHHMLFGGNPLLCVCFLIRVDNQQAHFPCFATNEPGSLSLCVQVAPHYAQKLQFASHSHWLSLFFWSPSQHFSWAPWILVHLQGKIPWKCVFCVGLCLFVSCLMFLCCTFLICSDAF